MKEIGLIGRDPNVTGGIHPLLRINRAGKILYACGEDLRLCGEELCGKNIFDYLSESVREKLHSLLKRSLPGGRTADLIAPAPKFCPYNQCVYFIYPLSEADSNGFAIIVLIDISGLHNAIAKLNAERRQLLEKNIALSEGLRHTEQEKKEYSLNLARNMEQNILPVLKRLVKQDGRVNHTQLRFLETSLVNMVPLLENIPRCYFKLSPREVEICNLIRLGATTREIAKAICLSVATVKKHREKIRRKLEILNKKINLISYLRQS